MPQALSEIFPVQVAASAETAVVKAMNAIFFPMVRTPGTLEAVCGRLFRVFSGLAWAVAGFP